MVYTSNVIVLPVKVNLHPTLQTQDEMKGGLLLDVVIQQGMTIFKLLACKDEMLLIRRDLFLVLDLGFDVVNGIQ